MPVCKFFLEGRCRYGDNCRFEHPRAGAQRNLYRDNNWHQRENQRVSFNDSFNSSGQNDRYKWASDSQQNQGSAAQQSLLDVVSSLPKEIEILETSKMWPLTCIGLEGNTPSIPDFYDISCEELRHEAHQAIKAGNISPYVEKYHQLLRDYANKRNQLKHMTMEAKKKWITFLDNARKGISQGTGTAAVVGQSFGSPPMTLFGKPVTSVLGEQNIPPSNIFAPTIPQKPSLLGPGPQQPFKQSLLGPGPQQPYKPSLLGPGPQQPFNASLFAPPPSMPHNASLFAPAPSQPDIASLFAPGPSQPHNASLFAQGPSQPQNANLFAQGPSQPHNANLFASGPSQQSATSFSSSPAFASVPVAGMNFGQSANAVNALPKPAMSMSQSMSSGLYTPLSTLNDQEKEAFMAKSFQLGKIPLRPPPIELIS